MLWHLIVVFGNRKWFNMLAAILVTNLLLISNYVIGGYLLFGDELYKMTGAKNIFDLIINVYKF